MKNLKVSLKLIISFLVVVALAIIVGVVGIIGMGQISDADTELYNSNLIAIKAMGSMNDATSSLRMHYRNFVIFNAEDPEFIESEAAIKQIESEFEEYMAIYQATIADPEDQATFDEIKRIYQQELMGKCIPAVLEAGLRNDNEAAKAAMIQYADIISKLDDMITDSVNYNTEVAEQAVNSNEALSSTMTMLEIGVLAVAVVIAMLLAIYISSIISKPLGRMRDLLSQMGNTGDLEITEETEKQIVNDSAFKDEIGQCIASSYAFIKSLWSVNESLGKVAAGDLTVEVKKLSEKDSMGNALASMVQNLNNMFGEIRSSAEQLNAGSKQIADGAQALAQGSTEQASAVEELSASISEIADKASRNANLAEDAAKLSDTIKDGAETGSNQMESMMSAVREINDASGQIGKVIKVIDDIAFQTNILALNAAVEAARAGEAGKGFAVVAEEVRNLAGKSAEAAKDTSGLIENSIAKANYGLEIATQTSDSLKDIVTGINESADIIDRIAQSSREEAAAVTQINTGIDQVAQVVQQNSATAEESAAASEEMSGQASMLDTLISQFKLK